MGNQAHVTDGNKSPGQAIQNSNTTQALLGDLKERGYKLTVGENGNLYIDPKGPPVTPVIYWALQANYKKLVRLLSPPVTDSNSANVGGIKKDNTDWSKVRHLAPKRGEELDSVVSEYKAVIEYTKAVVSAANPQSFVEGWMMHSREMDKYESGRNKEAKRRIEASKKGRFCGECGDALKDGESAYLSEHVYAGMAGSLTAASQAPLRPRHGVRAVRTERHDRAAGFVLRQPSLRRWYDRAHLLQPPRRTAAVRPL